MDAQVNPASQPAVASPIKIATVWATGQGVNVPRYPTPTHVDRIVIAVCGLWIDALSCYADALMQPIRVFVS